ncbi:CTP-dependent riboflavin kinase [Candidatus Micrarchaeota archaeon]|nr:CTP-dependent riboflavin kinase [Candidatus Micrarchaeota archaeon]
MDELLLLLLRHGAHIKPIKMTTTEISTELSMSQQNVSRRLILLEQDGYLERNSGLFLTKKAYDELLALYSSMKCIFEKKEIRLSGTIVSGLKEGSYYLSMPGYKNQMKEKLGFDPFTGTLNIQLDADDVWKRQYVLQLDPIIISGFKDKDRTYGDLFAYKCRAFDQNCALIVPLRTHHGPEIIELICHDHIKEKFKKKDGDKVKVVI